MAWSWFIVNSNNYLRFGFVGLKHLKWDWAVEEIGSLNIWVFTSSVVFDNFLREGVIVSTEWGVLSID